MSRFFDRRLLHAAESQRFLLGSTIALGMLAGATTVGQALVLSRAVDGAFLRGLDLASLQPWLLALVGFAVIRALTIWAGEVTANRIALRIKTRLRERLITHLLALGPAYTRDQRTGELANTVTEGVEALDAYFSQYLPQVALAAIVPTSFLIFIFPNDPLSGLVLLLTAPLIPVFMILIGNMADALTRRQWAALSRLSAHFLDILQGLTTLKLFGRSREQIAVIRQITDRHRDATLQVLRVAFLSALVLEMVGTLSTAIIAVEIGLRLLYGKMMFRDAFFVLILAPEFYLPLRLLGTRFHAGIAGVAAARRVFEVLETPLPVRKLAACATSPGKLAACTTSPGKLAACTTSPGKLAACATSPGKLAACATVSFQDVHYTYPGRDIPALNGISFDIGPGEKVAVVGPSGAGKSTIAQLLLGFIRPTTGKIVLGSEEAARSDSAVRPAWVPQAPYLFNTTVADNIRLGQPAAPLDAVVRAAEASGADAFIRALPHGYDTVIGERGARLSGGQAQRIALARALLLSEDASRDALLVVLDEPTANLDLETEDAVQAGIRRLLADHSALIIAHRLHTVRTADRILVMEQGRIVESGTHKQLLARRGAYWRLLTSRKMAFYDTFSSKNVLQDAAGVTDQSEDASRTEPCATPGLPIEQCPRTPLGLLLGFLTPFWPWVALSVLLGFFTISSSIGLLATSAWLIATAALQPSIAVLQVAIVGVRFFGIARGLFRYLERLVSHQVTFRLLAELRVWFYAAIEPLAPARLAGQRSGDLLSRIISDIGTLEQFYVRAVAPPFVALLTVALATLIVGRQHPSLILPFLTCLSLAGVVAPTLSQVLLRGAGRQATEPRAALNAALVDGVQGAADLVAFGAADAHVKHVRSLSWVLTGAQARMATVAGLSGGLGALATWLAVASVLAAATPLVARGELAGSSLAVLTLTIIASFEAVLPLPQAGQALEVSLAAARRLSELLISQPAPAESQPPAPESEDASRGEAALSVQGLTLRYAPDEAPALADISFEMQAGSRVAVIGASGAGKSTLIAALLRFWDYERGAVRLAGHDLRTLDPVSVRAQISVVTQQTHLFNATVRENLLLARPSATRAELEQAARAAQIHDVIAALPQGYETWIGEQGWQLSGGERQRLAIARALLKDAPILLLDEPTANLDATTEHAVFQALAPLLADKTTLIITHRLERLDSVDEILVLERGRLVERGSHAALLACDGLYRRLWSRQRDIIDLAGSA